MKPAATRFTHVIEPLLGLASVLLVWELVSRHVGNAVLVPPPAIVSRARSFGVGPAVPVFLIFYASLFPIFIATLDGVSRVDANLIHAAQSLGASRRLVIRHALMPMTRLRLDRAIYVPIIRVLGRFSTSAHS